MFSPVRYFDDFFNDFRRNDLKCDIYEEDANYHIDVDIPGFNKDEISIDMDNGYLTISACKEEVSNKNYIRQERTYGKYQRSFYLGDLDSENIKANFKDGMLKITVPKKAEIESKKVIEIED